MVDETGLWEFGEAVRGWSQAQGGEEQLQSPTEAEHDAMIAKHSVH